VLTNTEEHLEDFLWLSREIRSEGGEAQVVEASFVDGLTDPEITAMLAGVAPPAPPHSGATWVTRAGIYIDRIASAWLIRRFIDPAARVKFVRSRRYRPEAGEIRFDMFEGEHTHEGDRCTFEVLLQRFDLTADAALGAIAEIVHDMDFKDDKFARPETAGVARLIDALAASSADDTTRMERGSQLLTDLYAGFQRTEPRQRDD